MTSPHSIADDVIAELLKNSDADHAASQFVQGIVGMKDKHLQEEYEDIARQTVGLEEKKRLECFLKAAKKRIEEQENLTDQTRQAENLRIQANTNMDEANRILIKQMQGTHSDVRISISDSQLQGAARLALALAELKILEDESDQADLAADQAHQDLAAAQADLEAARKAEAALVAKRAAEKKALADKLIADMKKPAEQTEHTPEPELNSTHETQISDILVGNDDISTTHLNLNRFAEEAGFSHRRKEHINVFMVDVYHPKMAFLLDIVLKGQKNTQHFENTTHQRHQHAMSCDHRANEAHGKKSLKWMTIQTQFKGHLNAATIRDKGEKMHRHHSSQPRVSVTPTLQYKPKNHGA